MELLSSSVFKRLIYGITLVGGVALLITVIWVYGPLWGIGNEYPLSSKASRWLLISSVIFCLVVLIYRLPLLLLVLTILINVVWTIGPYFSIGQQRPLLEISYRLVVCALLLLGGGIYLFWHWLLKFSANPQPLLTRLSSLQSVKRDDFPELKSIFSQWRKLMQQRHQAHSWYSRFIWSKDSAQSLPWIMLVGPSGSGKTSALLASELTFPLPGQQIQATQPSSANQQCQCWLTEQAVWLDTPGRYFEPNNQTSAEWQALVELLPSKHSLSAIATVVLTIDCEKLWSLSSEELTEYAARYRENILLLQARKKTHLSLFLLITQIDHLSGFSDYFSGLSSEERQQVLGGSFHTLLTAGYQDSGRMEHCLSELVSRIEKGTLLQQQTNLELAARKRIENFAENFSHLVKLAGQFMQQITLQQTMSNTSLELSLSGIYFASSQSVMGKSLAHPHSLIAQWQAKQSVPQHASTEIIDVEFSDPDAETASYAQRSGYFLNQFFNQVVVKESQYRQDQCRKKFIHRAKKGAGLAVAVPLAGIILYALTLSYQHNQAYLAERKTHLSNLSSQLSANEIPLDQSLVKLNTLVAGQVLTDFTATFTPGHYGLYTGNQIVELVNSHYNQWLITHLLPMIEQVTVEAVQSKVQKGHSDDLVAALQVYLMLVGEIPLDINVVCSWLLSDTQLPSAMTHAGMLPAMIQRLFSTEWSQQRPVVDQQLVNSARQLLQQKPLATYLYQRLKQRTLAAALPAVGLPQLVNVSQAPLFEISGSYKVVPGLFTLVGYRYWQQQIATKDFLLEKAILEQVIVGGSSSTSNKAQQSALEPDSLWRDISAQYLVEYRKAWQEFLRSLRLSSLVNTQQASSQNHLQPFHYMLKNFSGTESQLRQLLESIGLQTQLVAELTSLSASPTVQSVASQQRIALEEQQVATAVDSYFSALHRFLAPQRQDSQHTLDNFEGSLNQLYLLLALSDPLTGKRDSAQLVAWSEALNKLAMQVKQMPDPIGQLFLPLLLGTDQQVKRQTRQISQQQINQDIVQFCRKNLMGRYPFAPVAEEVNLQAFIEMFSPQGKLATYFDQHLASIVDTHRRPWQFTAQSAPVSPQLLAMFEQGRLIQQKLFASGSGKLGFEVNLSVSHLAPSITQLLVDVNQQRLRYIHGPKRPSLIHWPSESSSPLFQIRAITADGLTAWNKSEPGHWGFLRWLEQTKKRFDPLSQQTELTFGDGPQMAVIQLTGLDQSVTDLIRSLRQFRCPGL